MDLTVSHSCPSCGGAVEMAEADRITSCPWCGVQNYMAGGAMLRFLLPDTLPAHIDRAALLYFPYLRFKGNILTCVGRKVQGKVLDTTHQGIESRLLPPSLGLRPQAMRIRMAQKADGGRFLKRRATPAAILERAERLARKALASAVEEFHHRAFIGETVSCLYLPLYLDHGRVHEAVLNRELGPAETWLEDQHLLSPFQPRWRPRFLAMNCPRCGAGMEGAADSVAVACRNCDSCWTEAGGRFERLQHRLVDGGGAARYLPFWRIEVESEGGELKSFADFLELANQTVVVRDAHRRRGLQFWVPAVKIRPRVFLTMAKGATLSQLAFPEGEERLAAGLCHPTLPLSEAVQAVKSVFAEASVNRRDVLPMLPRLRFRVGPAMLVFLPFAERGQDLVQHHAPLALAASVLRTGRRL